MKFGDGTLRAPKDRPVLKGSLHSSVEQVKQKKKREVLLLKYRATSSSANRPLQFVGLADDPCYHDGDESFGLLMTHSLGSIGP